MAPARPRLPVFPAALAALAAVLAVMLPAGTASAATVTAAGNRVWAISPAAQDHAGADRVVSADQHLGEPAPCPICAPGACVAPEAGTSLAPTGVRLSQSSVNGAAKIIESMKANGWVGDPIDVVRMPDSGLTTIDNTRVVAAHQAGIDVQALIHGFDDPLPPEFIDRFTTPKGGVPSTWGDAIMNRIGAQNSLFRNTYPFGSPFTGWVGN
jgi:hypothetical protein